MTKERVTSIHVGSEPVRGFDDTSAPLSPCFQDAERSLNVASVRADSESSA